MLAMFDQQPTSGCSSCSVDTFDDPPMSYAPRFVRSSGVSSVV